MIDPTKETIITPYEAVELPCLIVGGKRYEVETIRTWFLRGVRGQDKKKHTLEWIKMPCGRCTSVQAIERFLKNLNAVEPVKAHVSPTRAAAAINQLAKLGLA